MGGYACRISALIREHPSDKDRCLSGKDTVSICSELFGIKRGEALFMLFIEIASCHSAAMFNETVRTMT